jgi:hypothetical protein
MPSLNDFLTLVPTFPIDHLNALIALGGLGLAAFAIYVVFAVVTERQR